MRWASWLCSARQEPISSCVSVEVKSCLASHPWSEVASRMCRWLPQSFPSARHLHAVVPSLPRLFAASAGSWPFPLVAGRALYTASLFLAVISRVSGSSCRSAVLLSLQGPLLRWLKVNFSEAFIAWIHIKALRVFVESVLRCVVGILGWRGEQQGLEGKLGNSTPCCLPALLPFAFCDHVLAISILPKESPLAMCAPFSRARSFLPDLFVWSLPHLSTLDRAPVAPGRRPQTVLFLHPLREDLQVAPPLK